MVRPSEIRQNNPQELSKDSLALPASQLDTGVNFGEEIKFDFDEEKFNREQEVDFTNIGIIRSTDLVKNPTEKVVFGHYFKDFDLDQLISLYFALKSGLIEEKTKFIFNPDLETEQLTNPRILVLEGFSYPDEKDSKKNYKNHRNFTNGVIERPNQQKEEGKTLIATTAATELKNFLPQNISKNTLTNIERIKTLENYLDYVDNKAKIDSKYASEKEKLTNFLSHFLLLRDVFAHPETDIKGMSRLEKQAFILHHFIYLLEVFVEKNVNDQNYLVEMSKKKLMEDEINIDVKIKEFEEKKLSATHDVEKELKERLSDKNTFKLVTTMSGLKIAYFDVRGLKNGSGLKIERGFGVVKKAVKADLYFLVDDQFNDFEEKVGTQYLLDSKDEELNKELLLKIADRWQLAEAQFGKGYSYAIKSSFGSHSGLVGSPQSEGSAISPDEMWQSLLNFFDYERYPKEKFAQKVIDFAEKIGVKNFTILDIEPSNNPTKFGSRQVIFTLNNDNLSEGKVVTVKIAEEELSLYESVFTENKQENQRIVLQKTSVSEAKEIVEKKQVKALAFLDKYLLENDAKRILAVLNTINENTISKISLDKKMAILSCISTDEDAISHIWNKDDTTYGLVDERMPDELKANVENYIYQRYRLKSLARTVDTTLILSLINETIRSKNATLQESLAVTLTNIISSDIYKNNHKEESYDSLLPNIIFFLTEIGIDNRTLASKLLNKLISKYGNEMSTHWMQLDPSYRYLLERVFGDDFLEIKNLIKSENRTSSIQGLAGSKVVYPDLKEIQKNLENGASDGFVNILLEIKRPIALKVLQSECYDANNNSIKIAGFDSLISAGILDIYKSDSTIGDHIKFSNEVNNVFKDLLTKILFNNDNSKIRLVQGGFPVPLAQHLQSLLSETIDDLVADLISETYSNDSNKDPNTTAKDLQKISRETSKYIKKNRIFWTNYNYENNSYVDVPFYSAG